MAKPSKKKTPTEPLTVSKIYEAIQAKGFIHTLWLDLIFDIKEKPTYQRLRAMVSEVVDNTLTNIMEKPIENRDDRLKDTGLTEISIMTYTLDTVISAVMYQRYQKEFEKIVRDLIKDVLKSKAAEAPSSSKNNSMLENIDKIVNKKNPKSTDNKEIDSKTTDANKSQPSTSSDAGKEIKVAPSPARKRGRPRKAYSVEREAENGTTVPERKNVSLPKTPEKNIASFNDEIKLEAHDEMSDAESDVSVGNMSLESVSSVHTSELSSFEDNISICSDDEGEKKYVPLKVANEMYLRGKLSQIYQFGKNSDRLKRMKDAAASVSKNLTKTNNSDLTKINNSDLTKKNNSDLTKKNNSDLTKKNNSDLTKRNNSGSEKESSSARKVLPQRVRKPNPKYNSETMYCDTKEYSLPYADLLSASSQDEMDNKSFGPTRVQRKRKRSSLDKGTTSSPPKISSARNMPASKGGKPNNSPKSKTSTKRYDISDLYKPHY